MMDWRLNKQWALVSCATCGREWSKRKDSLAAWAGECRSCSSKRKARRPDIKEAMKRNGVLVMSRGPLPVKNRPRGAAHYNWKGGITPERARVYASLEMRAWRRAVLSRDGFACTICSATSDLATDHIKPLALFPELQFDVTNGRTLCNSCHGRFGARVKAGALVRTGVVK